MKIWGFENLKMMLGAGFDLIPMSHVRRPSRVLNFCSHLVLIFYVKPIKQKKLLWNIGTIKPHSVCLVIGFKLPLQKRMVMKGIEYLIDEKGERRSIVIDLKKWGELVEDLMDAIEAKQRVEEESIPYRTARQNIHKKKQVGSIYRFH